MIDIYSLIEPTILLIPGIKEYSSWNIGLFLKFLSSRLRDFKCFNMQKECGKKKNNQKKIEAFLLQALFK